jgi:hypothetical protein
MVASDRWIDGSAWSGRAFAWLLAAMLPLAFIGPVRAEDALATAVRPMPTAAGPDLMDSGGWRLSATPYAWAISLHGEAGAKGKKADVDTSFSDLLKSVNGAAMLDLELRKGRFGLLSDIVFANLEGDGDGPGGRLEVKTTANQLIQTAAATFRVGTWQLADFGEAGPLAVTVDPYAGIRYTYLDTELKGKLDLPDLGIDAKRTVEADKQWVDPVVGLRTIFTLGERLNLILAGDVGGTGGNDHSWEALGVVGYRFGLFGLNNADILAGYKVIDQKFTDGNGSDQFDWDITMHGPVLGLTIRF